MNTLAVLGSSFINCFEMGRDELGFVSVIRKLIEMHQLCMFTAALTSAYYRPANVSETVAQVAVLVSVVSTTYLPRSWAHIPITTPAPVLFFVTSVYLVSDPPDVLPIVRKNFIIPAC
jgi:hypothetical protein